MPHFLEREAPLDQLTDLLEHARHGRGQVVLVRGEAGIGKTSLVRRFADGTDETAYVLWGACDDLVTPRPLGPVHDMAAAEPALVSALAGDDRNAVFREAIELLSRSLRPTVMVIEDIQWADGATLDLIRFLGRRMDRTRGLLLLTYRDTDVPSDHPLRLVLGDLLSIQRIGLTPLSRAAVAEIVGDGARAEEVFELTGGNPFFVAEVAAAPGGSVPQSISDSVHGRLARLSAEARRLVELLSVIPGGAEVELMTKLVSDAVGVINEAGESGVVITDGVTVRFRHELARRAVASRLPEMLRRELNREVLVALENADADPARCAHHARESGDVHAQLRILPTAARRAAVAGSHTQALDHLDSLEPLLDQMDTVELADHFQLWAQEAHWAAQNRAFTLSETAIDMRRQLGDPIALGKCLLDASAILINRPDGGSLREEMASEALALLKGTSPENEAIALAQMSRIRLTAYDFEGALEYARSVIAIDAAPAPARVEALMHIGWVLLTTDPPQGLAEMEEAFRLAGREGLREFQVRAAVNLIARLVPLRRLDEAERWREAAATIVSEVEVPLAEPQLIYYRAALATRRGEWDRAEEVALEGLDLFEWKHPGRLGIGAELATVRVRRGSPDALPFLTDLWDDAMETGDVMKSGPVSTPIAERMWLVGDVASEVVGQVIKLYEAVLANKETWNAGELGQYLFLAGKIDGTPVPLPEPFQCVFDGDWAGAAAFWQARGYPYERAVALSLGDVEARLEALKILDALGAAALASRVRRDLRDEGVKGIPRGPYKGRRSSAMGLTPRQAEILSLIAGDKSNAEIADELFLSVRTVEHHVSAILTTLGVTTRQEASRLTTRGQSHELRATDPIYGMRNPGF